MAIKCGINLCRRREESACCAECGDANCKDRCANSPDRCGCANAKAYKPKQKKPAYGSKGSNIRPQSRHNRLPSNARAQILWMLLHREGSLRDVADHFGVSHGAILHRKDKLNQFRLQCPEEKWPPIVCKNGNCSSFALPICCHSCPNTDCPKRCQSEPRFCLRALMASEVDKVPRYHHGHLTQSQREEIFALLREGKLSREEIANRFDVTKQAISQYKKRLERGELP